LKSTSSLALAAAASWLVVRQGFRLRAVSLARLGDQVAGLRLRAGQAELSAESPRIGDPAGVLNGGARANIPFSRGWMESPFANPPRDFPEKLDFFACRKIFRPILQEAYA